MKSERTVDEIIDDYAKTVVHAIVRAATPRWIPVKEREPKTAKHVLVTIKWADDDYEVTELDYAVAKATNARYYTHTIAWMPLPEPYKEAEE